MAKSDPAVCPHRPASLPRRCLPRYRSRFSQHPFTQRQLLAILCLLRYEDQVASMPPIERRR